MSPALVGYLAAIYSQQARIEGMKAENAHRESCGRSAPYGEEAFNAVADQLAELSINAGNCP